MTWRISQVFISVKLTLEDSTLKIFQAFLLTNESFENKETNLFSCMFIFQLAGAGQERTQFLHGRQDWKTNQVSTRHKVISHLPTTTLRVSVSLMFQGYTSDQSFSEKLWSGHTLFLMQKTLFILAEVVKRWHKVPCDGSPCSVTQAASRSAPLLCSEAARRM